MLVIDGVELVLSDQAFNMRELERDHAGRSKQVRHSCREVVKIRNLREHVVADYQIGLTPLGDETLCEVQAEKLDKRRNILFTRRLCDIRSRLDANHRNIER